LTLEEYIAQVNSLAFWKEFTFSQNKFAPQPGQELELADNLVWLGDHAYALQLKEREGETDDPDAERSWFKKKVLGKATSQIRDTLRFLGEHEKIRITNERGHGFDIRLAELTKVVVFLGGRALPEDCWRTRCHVSRTAGFIHIIAAHDYVGILEKLRMPADIHRYFAYREEVIPKLVEAGIIVDESDIVGAFLWDEDLPTPKSRESSRRFVQDADDFDLSPLLANLHDHIERSEQPYNYYRIMLGFARVPRSVWREVKIRFMKSLQVVREGEFARPFRLAFPATVCAFMIAPLDARASTTGLEGEKLRVRGITNLTAMYDTKTSKGVGILISKDGKDVLIDWSLLEVPWKQDEEMEAMLARNYPFREAKEKILNSFLFEVAAPEKGK
jgi:hypothetical protein